MSIRGRCWWSSRAPRMPRRSRRIAWLLCFGARLLCAGRSRPSNRATRTTRRCTRCSLTARDTSRSPERSRRRVWRCGRSAMRCSMRWTGTRRAQARKATRFPWPSSGRRSSSTTRRSSWLRRRRSKASAGSRWHGKKATSAISSCRARSAVTTRCSCWAMERGPVWCGPRICPTTRCTVAPVAAS